MNHHNGIFGQPVRELELPAFRDDGPTPGTIRKPPPGAVRTATRDQQAPEGQDGAHEATPSDQERGRAAVSPPDS